VSGAAASTNYLAYFEYGSGFIVAPLSYWTAIVPPSEGGDYSLAYRIIQAFTILCLVLYIILSTTKRRNRQQADSEHVDHTPLDQPSRNHLAVGYFFSSFGLGMSLAASIPGRSFQQFLEGFMALGFFAMGYVFDNARIWWEYCRERYRDLWDLLAPLRPARA
jgi:hypothetical protein